MIAAQLPHGPIRPPIPATHQGRPILIDRRYHAPKGKVCIGYRRPGGGCGMTTIDDTDRLETTRG